MDMFISIAASLFNTDESIATPCSVKAKGIYRVPPLLFEDAICDLKLSNSSFILQEKQKTVGTFREQYELSFNAHLNLVTIHPWVDDNGRTARLLMNWIQFYYHLFPAKIFKEDREEYNLSLRQCQDEESNQPFLAFMAGQLKKSLSLEIERFNVLQKRGFSFMF